jgi:hypothetical protein
MDAVVGYMLPVVVRLRPWISTCSA